MYIDFFLNIDISAIYIYRYCKIFTCILAHFGPKAGDHLRVVFLSVLDPVLRASYVQRCTLETSVESVRTYGSNDEFSTSTIHLSIHS